MCGNHGCIKRAMLGTGAQGQVKWKMFDFLGMKLLKSYACMNP